ncbi:hypothetical protein [Desulfurispora thermophila]|uniref:hypothetical protein n=1 Tax=Desulfurispora thermophila TaxID=265470 RepID=UPI0012EA990D
MRLRRKKDRVLVGNGFVFTGVVAVFCPVCRAVTGFAPPGDLPAAFPANIVFFSRSCLVCQGLALPGVVCFLIVLFEPDAIVVSTGSCKKAIQKVRPGRRYYRRQANFVSPIRYSFGKAVPYIYCICRHGISPFSLVFLAAAA